MQESRIRAGWKGLALQVIARQRVCLCGGTYAANTIVGRRGRENSSFRIVRYQIDSSIYYWSVTVVTIRNERVVCDGAIRLSNVSSHAKIKHVRESMVAACGKKGKVGQQRSPDATAASQSSSIGVRQEAFSIPLCPNAWSFLASSTFLNFPAPTCHRGFRHVSTAPRINAEIK